MQNILELPIGAMAGISFDCDCGRHHSVDIKQILVGSGVFNQIADTIKLLNGRCVCIIADGNTYEVAGARAEKLLEAAGITFHTVLFPSRERLTPDEAALGHIVAALNPEDDLILTVGSGTLNDLSRLVSFRTGIPYIIAATAPSMDGYASTVSPLILCGEKVTLPGTYPAAIVADTSIMKDAPMEMLTAGFGDIIGKYNSDTDWRLSSLVNAEHYCKTCAGLVSQAVKKCAENGARLKERDEDAVNYVTQALILSGVAMGLFCDSRPASGAEHHISHYWEVDALSKGMEHSLHGNSVSVAAVITAHLYELAKPYLPKELEVPDKATIMSVIASAGAPMTPQDVGISKALFHESILRAMDTRERYTILRFCDSKGLLECFADKLTETFYTNHHVAPHKK